MNDIAPWDFDENVMSDQWTPEDLDGLDAANWNVCDEHETTYMRHDYCKDCRIKALESLLDEKNILPALRAKDKRITALEAEKADRIETFEEWKASVIGSKELADNIIIDALKSKLAERCAVEGHLSVVCDSSGIPRVGEHDGTEIYLCYYCGERLNDDWSRT